MAVKSGIKSVLLPTTATFLVLLSQVVHGDEAFVRLQTPNSHSSSYWNRFSVNPTGGNWHHPKVIVLYNTSELDRSFQLELLNAVRYAFQSLNEQEMQVFYIDLAANSSSLQAVAVKILQTQTPTIVSLLQPQVLAELTRAYDILRPVMKLTIVTPRPVDRKAIGNDSVRILCLQMSQMAAAMVVINRAEKEGMRTLVPVLDGDSLTQLEQLQYFFSASENRINPLRIAPPIFLRQGRSLDPIISFLHGESNSTLDRGVLLLTTNGAQHLMKAASGNELIHLRWFSPNFIEYDDPNNSDNKTVVYPALYSISYVGSRGWDNPSRRQALRELSSFMPQGAGPRILQSILAYDAAWVASNYARAQLSLPMQGLSGEISFDAEGYRQEGVYFGVSSIAQSAPVAVKLLQPSSWILEDVINVVKTIDGQYLITEYSVATSSVLTKDELLRFARSKGNSSVCVTHAMEVLSHDPFSQVNNLYFFTSDSLPDHLVIPNQHGYGITFACRTATRREVTLKIACTAGLRFSDPVKCFRSRIVPRRKRSVPANRYYVYPNGYSQYRAPQGYLDGRYFSKRDDSNHYYYGSSDSLYPNSATYSSLTTKLDIPIVSEDVTSTTQQPVGGPKIPELRQILKAAKPFVGSCVGSATGCAMCVLVLGRLPLGTLPPACTGPCFVGTFGSCGSLLGRAFSETTVICTELFRQGYLDLETFLADAEFGRSLREENPTVFKGYHYLATPIVAKMKESKMVTEVVAKFALPWAQHMKYKLGYSDNDSLFGFLLHFFGSQVCFMCGVGHDLLPVIAIPLSSPAIIMSLLSAVSTSLYLRSKKW